MNGTEGSLERPNVDAHCCSHLCYPLLSCDKHVCDVWHMDLHRYHHIFMLEGPEMGRTAGVIEF